MCIILRYNKYSPCTQQVVSSLSTERQIIMDSGTMPLDGLDFEDTQRDTSREVHPTREPRYGLRSLVSLIFGTHHDSPVEHIREARRALDHIHHKDTSWWIRLLHETLADFALTRATKAYTMATRTESLLDALNVVHDGIASIDGVTRLDVPILAEALYMSYVRKKKHGEDITLSKRLIQKCYLIAQRLGNNTCVVHVAYFVRLIHPNESREKMEAVVRLGIYVRDYGNTVLVNGSPHERHVLALAQAAQYQARSARAFELYETSCSRFE